MSAQLDLAVPGILVAAVVVALFAPLVWQAAKRLFGLDRSADLALDVFADPDAETLPAYPHWCGEQCPCFLPVDDRFEAMVQAECDADFTDLITSVWMLSADVRNRVQRGTS